MKKPLLLFTCVIIAAMLSCSNRSNNQGNEKITEVKVRSSTISTADGETLELNTFIYDNCLVQDASTYKSAVKLQELFFLKNGARVLKADNPINITSYIDANCADSLRVLESVIYEIGVLEGRKNTLFCIKGAGLCNACPELFAFYNTSGKCIWLNYANKYKVFSSYGDFKEVCRKEGIDSLAWFEGRYKKIEVDL